MGGGREEGLVKEGGAVGVPSAQAPRGAGGGRGRALCATSCSCCRPFIVCYCSGDFSWGGLGNLVWASVYRRLALKVF